jgi:DNA-directed RNA polymerase sigma subunit (sigma70/sigma32)
MKQPLSKLTHTIAAHLDLPVTTVRNAMQHSITIVSPDDHNLFEEGWASMAPDGAEDDADSTPVEGALGSLSFVVDHLLQGHLRPEHAALLSARYGLDGGKPLTTPELMAQHGFRTRGAMLYHLKKASAALVDNGGAQLRQFSA